MHLLFITIKNLYHLIKSHNLLIKVYIIIIYNEDNEDNGDNGDNGDNEDNEIKSIFQNK